jgi:hypothetical protein
MSEVPPTPPPSEQPQGPYYNPPPLPNPGTSNYYRPGSVTGPQLPGPAKVSFDSIEVAWNLTKSDYGTWIPAFLLMALLVSLVNVPISLLSNYIAYGSLATPPMDYSSTFFKWYGISMGLGIISQGFSYVFLGGVLNIAYKKLSGEPATVADLFSGFSKFGQLFAAGVLVYVASLLATCLLIIPGIYLAGAFAFTPLIIIRQDMGAIDAMKKSMDTLRGGQAFMMFFLLFVAALASALGFIACFVGVIFTLPIVYCTIAASYYNFYPPNTVRTAVGSLGAEPPSYQV